MASEELTISCGCGRHFKATISILHTLEEAKAHCDSSGHLMEIIGSIKPDPGKLKAIKAVKLQERQARTEQGRYDSHANPRPYDSKSYKHDIPRLHDDKPRGKFIPQTVIVHEPVAVIDDDAGTDSDAFARMRERLRRNRQPQ